MLVDPDKDELRRQSMILRVEELLGAPYEEEFTVADLMDLLVRNQIPVTAKLSYTGCGSHTFSLSWRHEE